MFTLRTIATAGAVGVLALTSIAGPALGSSHREAPSIANDPSADITDLYAFVSPDKPDTVTIIANYNGLQEPAGGPNFYPFNPDVLYWIKVDNTGDGVEDVAYRWQFSEKFRNPNSFLYAAPTVDTVDDPEYQYLPCASGKRREGNRRHERRGCRDQFAE